MRVKFEWHDAYGIGQQRCNESCTLHVDKRVRFNSALVATLKQLEGVDAVFFNGGFQDDVGTYKGDLFRGQMFSREQIEAAVTAELTLWSNDSMKMES